MEMKLIQKLKVKPGAVAVINSPNDILGEFKSFKPVVTISAGVKEYFDFVLLFASNSKELELSWKRILPALKKDAVFWIAYPKKKLGHPVRSWKVRRRLDGLCRLSVAAGCFRIN